jgi:hypothetical protein
MNYYFSLLAILVFARCSTPEQRSNSEARTNADSSLLVKDTTAALTSPEQSEITCPKCGFKKMEVMPTDVCQLKYTCTKCQAELYPEKGDCCVFCTYGTKKCPSMQ